VLVFFYVVSVMENYVDGSMEEIGIGIGIGATPDVERFYVGIQSKNRGNPRCREVLRRDSE
jgi:hypothetical protein